MDYYCSCDAVVKIILTAKNRRHIMIILEKTINPSVKEKNKMLKPILPKIIFLMKKANNISI